MVLLLRERAVTQANLNAHLTDPLEELMEYLHVERDIWREYMYKVRSQLSVVLVLQTRCWTSDSRRSRCCGSLDRESCRASKPCARACRVSGTSARCRGQKGDCATRSPKYSRLERSKSWKRSARTRDCRVSWRSRGSGALDQRPLRSSTSACMSGCVDVMLSVAHKADGQRHASQ